MNNLNPHASSRRRSGDLAIEDPSSHIVASIHSFVRVAQIEEKLLRIFMRNPTGEKWTRGFRVAREKEWNEFTERQGLISALNTSSLSPPSSLLQFFAFSSLSAYPLSTWASSLLGWTQR